MGGEVKNFTTGEINFFFVGGGGDGGGEGEGVYEFKVEFFD